MIHMIKFKVNLKDGCPDLFVKVTETDEAIYCHEDIQHLQFLLFLYFTSYTHAEIQVQGLVTLTYLPK